MEEYAMLEVRSRGDRLQHIVQISGIACPHHMQNCRRELPYDFDPGLEQDPDALGRENGPEKEQLRSSRRSRVSLHRKEIRPHGRLHQMNLRRWIQLPDEVSRELRRTDESATTADGSPFDHQGHDPAGI